MKILFITATRIGDAVISTGILRHLVEKNQGAAITIACGPHAASLFAAVPGLKDVIVLKKKVAGIHWLYLWAKVVNTRWDLVVDLRRSLIPYLVSANSRLRLGPDDRKLHRVEFLSSILTLDPPSAPRIWTSTIHQDRARDLVAQGASIIAVAPVAARAEKTWPIRRFVELINCLIARDGMFPGAHIIAVGAEEDRNQLAQFTSEIDGSYTNLIGCDDLLTVYAVLSHANLVITNDSGLGHLSAAAQRPTVALFGPTDPKLYRPWGDCVVVSRAPSTRQGRLMDNLAVNDVQNAVASILKSGV